MGDGENWHRLSSDGVSSRIALPGDAACIAQGELSSRLRLAWSLEFTDRCLGGCGGRCSEEELVDRIGVVPPKSTAE